MTALIVGVFILGYLLIAFESVTKISKTAVAMLMCVVCWILYSLSFGINSESFVGALGETSEILFFLMGAMVIVEVVDTYGGFNFVRRRLHSRSKKALLWKITFFTFFLSAVLDNLTTAIVMIMVLRKLVDSREERLYYASMVILAANSGGAFSPIGDVTTIMLWVKGNISSGGVITSLFFPSVISVVIPALLIGTRLKGDIVSIRDNEPAPDSREAMVTRKEKKLVFAIGVGGAAFCPDIQNADPSGPLYGNFAGTVAIMDSDRDSILQKEGRAPFENRRCLRAAS